MRLGFIGVGNISSDVIHGIFNSKINLSVYDPKVNSNQIFFDLEYLNGNDKNNKKFTLIKKAPLDCVKQTNIIAILTEWDEFKDYDWANIFKKMNKPAYIFDGRNILNREELESIGFNYIGLGR